ncbi:MAG: hypothetical protein ABI655_04285 [Phenylobacterium sp.]
MIIRLVAVVALAFATSAMAAPYGGASPVTVRAEAKSTRDFSATAPDVMAEPGGVRIHGQVCRSRLEPTPAPQSVRLEHRDGEGRVVEVSTAPLVGNLAGKPRLGCAYYSLDAQWQVRPTDTVRACLLGRGAETSCAGLAG